jgi:tryptophan-rich sensory protein
MTAGSAAAIAGAICAAAAALEGLGAGSGVRSRLEALRQPAHSPPFAGWVVIGIAYYAICFAVLFRVLRLPASQSRAAALAATVGLLLGNALWSYAFFRRGSLAAGVAVLTGYAALAVILEALLVRLDGVAAGVFLVYVLYLGYAIRWLRSLRRLNAAARG